MAVMDSEETSQLDNASAAIADVIIWTSETAGDAEKSAKGTSPLQAASKQAPAQLSVADIFAGAKQPRGRNALHEALTANDSAAVARLIDSGDVALLNQQSRHGCTPLMMLAMGHCDEALLWRLLERSGAASVALRSETRRTAADYAEEIESRRDPRVATALRTLEAEEMERTAQYRCSACGDVVKRRPLLAFFWERAERGGEENVVLKRFFATECYRTMLSPRFHQINDARQIRKELSESVAVLEALENELPSFGSTWNVVDLCCGKSITAALTSLKYPGVSVSAIDKLEPRFVPHFNCDEEAGVHYTQLDVLSDGFIPDLEQLVRKAARPTALLGMHLCGNLSVRAVEAFHRIGGISAVVLSPCCLPRKGGKSSPPHLYVTKDSLEQYRLWCQHLEGLLCEVVPAARVTSASVQNMLSPKNVVMCAVKPSDVEHS